MASYAPILNLYVDALTTGPHSRLIQDMARQMNKPVFDVAVGVANFTYALLNVTDVVLRGRPVEASPSASSGPMQRDDSVAITEVITAEEFENKSRTESSREGDSLSPA